MSLQRRDGLVRLGLILMIASLIAYLAQIILIQGSFAFIGFDLLLVIVGAVGAILLITNTFARDHMVAPIIRQDQIRARQRQILPDPHGK